jgi:hypothetical protein
MLTIYFFVVKGHAADATDAPQALRLIVQHCDEDVFPIFPCNGAPAE